MKAYIFFVIVLLTTSGLSIGQVDTTYWETGSILSIGATKNGKKIGTWTYYSKEGGKSEGEYEKSTKVGVWEYLTPDGLLEQTITYGAGKKKSRLIRYYHRNGNIKGEGVQSALKKFKFAEPILHPFNHSGWKHYKGWYYTGLYKSYWKRVGLWSWWDEHGYMVKGDVYRKGVLIHEMTMKERWLKNLKESLAWGFEKTQSLEYLNAQMDSTVGKLIADSIYDKEIVVDYAMDWVPNPEILKSRTSTYTLTFIGNFLEKDDRDVYSLVKWEFESLPHQDILNLKDTLTHPYLLYLIFDDRQRLVARIQGTGFKVLRIAHLDSLVIELKQDDRLVKKTLMVSKHLNEEIVLFELGDEAIVSSGNLKIWKYKKPATCPIYNPICDVMLNFSR
ncbi:MAG: hypothetical protein JKY52_13810 [Flavobacteriales bacterium]|nr:hypothetical protein [Flavobacteriales bacterium]